MKLHFAGADGNNIYTNALHKFNVKNKLESYHSLGKKMPSEDFCLLLDSGGFVARLRGVEINVYDYVEYLNKYNVKMAFNLDTLSLEETLKNQEILDKETNTYIIPVYHKGEYELDISNGNKIIDSWVEKYPYISIGGLVDNTTKREEKTKIIDHVFVRTRDKTKVHGLGCTNMTMMSQWPWYSVDSTSWLAVARFGRFSKEFRKFKIYDTQPVPEHWAYYKTKEINYKENLDYEIPYWLYAEDVITQIWKERGIVWNEFKPEDYFNI